MTDPEFLRRTISQELTKEKPDWHLIEKTSRIIVDNDNDNVRVSVDAGHIQRLGLELVARQETALAELIKNAYDADASLVTVTFQNQDKAGGRLVIEDNGHGMTLQVVRDSWMRLSTPFKQAEPKSPKYLRLRAGRKGIGRFAVQRLGKTLTMETEVKGNNTGIRVSFDWDLHFTSGLNLNDIFNQVEQYKKPIDREGTRLQIDQLRETWPEVALNRVWKMILSLQSPFVTLTKGNTNSTKYADPGFEVRLNGESSQQRETTLSIETGFLQHALAIITGSIDENGNASVRVVSQRTGLDDSHTIERKFLLTGPLTFSARYFIYSAETLSGLGVPLAKDMGTEYGGIRIYRNGFRVAPYGERSDDWLGLDRDTSRRNIIVPASNVNFFGHVSLDREDNPLFEETSSREGLIENEAFEEMRTAVRAMLQWAFLRVASSRGRKQTAGQKGFVSTARPRKPSEIIDTLYTEIEAKPLEKLDLFSSTSTEEPKNPDTQPTSREQQKRTPEIAAALQALELAREEAKLWEAEVERREAASLQYEEMLRILASLGLSISVFGHEIKGIRSSIAAHLKVISKIVSDLPVEVKEQLSGKVEGLKDVTGRMFDLGGYISGLMSNTESRQLRPISLKGAIERFHQQFMQYLDRQRISFEWDVTPSNLRTADMHASELDSVLLNFLTNSIKSMRAAKVMPRLVRVCVKQEGDLVLLSFQDNGLGISEESKDHIFDAFYTTSVGIDSDDGLAGPGTGLGLKIVSDIASSYGGSVAVGSPSEGYTCNIEFRVLADRVNKG